MIWIKDAPKFGECDDSEVCNFIDQYVSCEISKEEGKLKELVLLLQQHKHSSYCKRGHTCRLSFPHPPSSKTLIAQPDSDSATVAKAQSVLLKVRKVLTDGGTDNEADGEADNETDGETDMSLDKILELAEVALDGTQKL